jgi:hypothetical protein
MEYYTSKVLTTAGLAMWGARMMEVKARMEVLLPLWCCTIVAHILTHLHTFFERAGPMHISGMLAYERYHTLVKSMARGTRNVLVSTSRGYERLKAAQKWRTSGELTGKLLRRNGIRPDTPTQPYYYDPGWHTDEAWNCKGKRQDVLLDNDKYSQLLQMWCNVHPVCVCVCVCVYLCVCVCVLVSIRINLTR